MDPAGLPPGVVASVLWGIVFYGVRSAFAGAFSMQTETGFGAERTVRAGDYATPLQKG